jgi:alkanesulfonate monooxygenase SsuD/methylene tetrahydromethanopterin reductase-like flavin-dependent oxidoreductase (luciferase family)
MLALAGYLELGTRRSMKFNHFLSAYYPDTSYGGDRLYADMVTQAQLVDRLGYRGVTIPEHHLINILLVPDPLQMAVKVASVTRSLEIITSVCVLPLHDMRVFAGQAIQAEFLCEGRLILGVGRGAFAYELARMGKPIEESRERFDESLEVLQALFKYEEVSWDGKYYQFAPITVMPRPLAHRMPQIMVAALIPEGIEASAKRGFHIQTTPLDATVEKMKQQVAAFFRGKASLGEGGKHLRLALSRVCCVAEDDADARNKLQLAYEYYGRFHNVFTGPGIVEHGAIRHLPLKQSMEEFKQNVIVCTAAEMVDRLKLYEELGIDDFIMNVNIGHSQEESLDAVNRFAADVMPWFTMRPRQTRIAALAP